MADPDVGPAPELSDRKKKVARRNSAILREAFDDAASPRNRLSEMKKPQTPQTPKTPASGPMSPLKKSTSAVGPPTTPRGAPTPKAGGFGSSKGSESSTRPSGPPPAFDDDDDEGPPDGPPPEDEDDDVPPPALPPKNIKRENAMEAMNSILASLLALDERLDQYRYSNDVLPAVLCDHFDGMHSTVTSMLSDLKQLEGELKDYTMNDVDALLGGNIAKIYSSASAQNYRRTVETESSAYKAWHCPEFFDDGAVAPGSTVQVNIHLDEKAAWPFTMNCDAADTAETIVQQALVKATFAMSAIKGADYVLKPQGFNEFLKGAKRMMDYAYMRHCARKSLVAELWLVQMPQPKEDAPTTPTAEVKHPPPPPPANGHVPKQSLKHSMSAAGPPVDDDAELEPWESTFPDKISVSDLTLPFRVRVCGMENLPASLLFSNSPGPDPTVSIEVIPFMGQTLLSDTAMTTEPVRLSCNPRWMQWLSPGHSLSVSQLPRETRLGFLVFVAQELAAWCSMPLLDECGTLIQGPLSLRLRVVSSAEAAPAKKLGKKEKEAKVAEDRAEYLEMMFRGPTGSCDRPDVPLLHLAFDEFMLPVTAPPPTEEEKDAATLSRLAGLQTQGKETANNLSKQKDQVKQRDVLLKRDVLYKLTWEDKKFLWAARYSFQEEAHMLPFFLESVDWTKREFRLEAQRLLTFWKPPLNPSTPLRLLDVQFADTKVREYAVKYLSRLPPHKLQPFLLQLTQCLKFETYHRSALSKMLVSAALQSPYVIGHHLFWNLKSEMAFHPNLAERFTLILEEFLSKAGPAVAELRKQHDAVLKLQGVAEMVVARIDSKRYAKADVVTEYHDELRRLNKHFFDQRGNMQVPLNPKLEVGSLIVEKCRFMSSKKVPLWLTFKNADQKESKPVHVMFKSGDDLRQDMLTIQLLRFMDDVWLQDGLDMRLTPYRCIATGVNAQNEGVGMIELVLNADTTEGILRDFGGTYGAFKMTPLRDFLVKYNETEEKMKIANENFVRSCAGYCVATYVLGIGDRHSGNIMIAKDGHLFHIDFGHFLGNKKKKMGMSRERDPFVFTPEMAFIVGGGVQNFTATASYKKFKELCGKAFNSLRQHASMIETLFALMVSAGMPELVSVSDIEFARLQLDLELGEKEAAEVFMKAVDSAVTTTSRRFDNFFHELKHGGGKK